MNNINIILDLDENIKINSYPNELLQCLFNIFNNAKDAFLEKEIEDKYIFISSRIKKNQEICRVKENFNNYLLLASSWRTRCSALVKVC